MSVHARTTHLSLLNWSPIMRFLVACLLFLALTSVISQAPPGDGHLLRYNDHGPVSLDGDLHRRASRLHEGAKCSHRTSAAAVRVQEGLDSSRTDQALQRGRQHWPSHAHPRPVFLPGTSTRQERSSPHDPCCGRWSVTSTA